MAEIDYTKYGYVPEESKDSNKIDYSKYGAVKDANESSSYNDEEVSPYNETDLALDILGGKVPGRKGSFQPPVGLAQMVFRAAPKLASMAKEGASKYLNLVGQQGKEALESTAQHPIRSAGTFTAGMGDLLQNILNIPRNTPKLLSELELLNPKIGKALTSPYQFDLSRATNSIAGGNYPGSELIRKTGEGLPIIAPTVKAASQVAKAPFKMGGAIIGKSNPKLIAQEEALVSDLTNKGKSFNEASQEAYGDVQNYKEAQRQAKEETGLKEAEALQYKLNENKNNIENLKNEHEEIKNNLDNMQEPEKTPLYPENATENVRRAKDNVIKAEQGLRAAQEHHAKSQEIAEQSENNISTHLDRNAEHDVELATRLEEKQSRKHADVSKEYNEIESDFSKKNVILKNEKSIRELNDELIKLVNENPKNAKGPEATNLMNQIMDIKNKKGSIRADDYLKMFRSARRSEVEAWKDAYRPGIDAEERGVFKERAKQLSSKVKQMEELLEDSVGKESYKRLKDANKTWREDIIPIERNRIFRKIKNEGIMNEDVIKSVRGRKPATSLMREMIKNDPEMAKLAVGQRYAAKPSEIYEPNARMRSYLDKMPELKEMIRQRQDAHNITEEAKSNLKEAQSKYNDAVKNHENTQDLLEKRNKAESRLEKSHREETEKYNKGKQKLEKDIQSYEKDIKEREAKIEPMERHIKELTAKFNKSKISLKEKSTLAMEIKKAKIDLSNLKKDVDKSKSGIRKLWHVGKTIYKIGRKLT